MENEKCHQPMGICVDSSLGRMVLPSTNCICKGDIGPGRVSMPPILWLLMGAGIVIYAWLSNWNAVKIALGLGWPHIAETLFDFANLLLPLTLLGVVIFTGGLRELSLRRKAEAHRLQQIQDITDLEEEK